MQDLTLGRADLGRKLSQFMEEFSVIFDCQICKKNTAIQSGDLKVLEVRDMEGNIVYDWTGGGGINHYLCEECFDGLAKDIYRKGAEVLV